MQAGAVAITLTTPSEIAWSPEQCRHKNEIIDAASIEVSRRLRHVKTDRLDSGRLLAKLIRHHSGRRSVQDVLMEFLAGVRKGPAVTASLEEGAATVRLKLPGPDVMGRMRLLNGPGGGPSRSRPRLSSSERRRRVRLPRARA
jgi:hypothetical protein